MPNGTQGQPPSGWTWAHFKAISIESGQWIWGTVEGSFNDKMSTSQVIVDAVIGCIPLVGDVTAVRDLIAVSIGLADDPKKREDTWEWVLFGVLLLALIPVLGGALKGVGRLIVRFARDIAKLGEVARAAKLAEAAKSIVKVLNHFKFVGNAEAWLLKLRFADYQGKMVWALDEFTGRVSGALDSIKGSMSHVLPDSMLRRIDSLKHAMGWLRVEFRKRIPDVIKEADAKLHEIQSYIRAGGDTTSRTVTHEVVAGEKNITYTEEARLHEDGEVAPKVPRMGRFKANDNIDLNNIANVYQHEPGYPDLLAYKDLDTGAYPNIAAFSGKIENESLAGKKVFRLFGKKGTTFDVDVGESDAAGRWWGIGEAPTSPGEWRDPCAVLDEWNRDGFQVTAEIPKVADIKAATGKVAEQYSKDIPGQELVGGGDQALLDVDKVMPVDKLNAIGKQVMKSGQPKTWVDPATGIKYEFKKTPWSEADVNGTIGYGEGGPPGKVSTEDLGQREIADKHYQGKAR